MNYQNNWYNSPSSPYNSFENQRKEEASTILLATRKWGKSLREPSTSTFVQASLSTKEAHSQFIISCLHLINLCIHAWTLEIYSQQFSIRFLLLMNKCSWRFNPQICLNGFFFLVLSEPQETETSNDLTFLSQQRYHLIQHKAEL